MRYVELGVWVGHARSIAPPNASAGRATAGRSDSDERDTTALVVGTRSGVSEGGDAPPCKQA